MALTSLSERLPTYSRETAESGRLPVFSALVHPLYCICRLFTQIDSALDRTYTLCVHLTPQRQE